MAREKRKTVKVTFTLRARVDRIAGAMSERAGFHVSGSAAVNSILRKGIAEKEKELGITA